MNFKGIIFALTGVAGLLTAGCAPFVERVDLAKIPAEEAQAALRVRLFTVGTIYPEVSQMLGPVTAFSCKNKPWEKPASTGDALAQLRLKAKRMGANAVVDVTTDTRGTDAFGTNCWQTVQASGTAVIITAH